VQFYATVCQDISLGYGVRVQGSKTRGDEIFRTRPDRPRGPSSFLYSGHHISFPGFKGRGVALETHLQLVERLKKGYSYTSRLKSGNACYHSVQNLLSSSLPSKSIKIKIYRTIILPVVLYGCEGWSLTWREECRLRVFENRVLRRIFGPKRDEVTG
jgi:hypothetical protein